jgi:carboxyl-terminal processing protease
MFKPTIGLICFVFLTAFNAHAQLNTPQNKDKFVGNIIKNALETYHFKKIKIDDSLSEHAFKEYLKRVDYSKQFLIKKDVKELSQYKKLMDDQMVSGMHQLLDRTNNILKKRIKLAQTWQKEIFKKNFDFNKKEFLELDPDKKEYVKSEKELKGRWRKVFKQSALIRYLSLIEQKEEDIKEAKKPKSKKDKNKEKKKKKLSKKKDNEDLTKMSNKQLLAKAHKAIDKKYKNYFSRLLKDNHQDHLEKFFNSISMIFDPHTNYLPPKKKEDFDIDISGSLEGIGAVLSEDEGYIKVVSIVPGGAAWRQKDLAVDDLILLVAQGDGEPVDLVDMRVDDAVRYIRGKKGTEVRLTVKRVDGTRKVIKIIRDVVQIEAGFAKSSMLESKLNGDKVGYILVPKFYRDFGDNGRNCTADVKREVERLKAKGMKGLILDLRNNGGGALEDARQMSGLFIKKGPIVQVKGHTGNIEVLRDTDPEVSFDGPFIVLINKYSASASEILAGAMQDYKRAIIAGGEFSHGKGTVQAVLNLNQGPLMSIFGATLGALKVTIQKFYRVTGNSTQYKGVTPDIIFPDPYSYAKNGEKDLDFSLPWDEVKALDFKPWKKSKFDMKKIVKRSGSRVSKNPRFNKIVKTVKLLRKRQDETKVSLNIVDVRKKDKETKEINKKLKNEDENMDILVTNFEESLKSGIKIRPGEEKQWKEDFKQRKEDWIKGLRLDPGIEESLNIISDMIKSAKGAKLTALRTPTKK